MKITLVRRTVAWTVTFLTAVGSLPGVLAAKEQGKRPNVLLIVADDLGYCDLGCFGGEIHTPNLDALARRGVRFTDFHTAATCSPTRSMLITGTDNHLAGLGTMGEVLAPSQKGKPGYEGHLNDRVVTVASLLRDAGYFTCMAGKWHLGERIEHDPSRRGFQRAYALLPGGASHFDDEWMLSANYTPIYRENGVRVHVPRGFYSTEFYTDKLIEYIDGRKAGQPFFAYLAFTAPHDPLHAPDDWIDKYKGRYDAGYDSLRKTRLKRLKEMGFIPPEAKPFPRLPNVPAWDRLTGGQKKAEARKMEIYAAMVGNIDHHLGRLFAHLEKTGGWENTLVVFFSDNGANGAQMHQYPQTDEAWVERNSDNRYENMGRRFSRIATGPAWAQVSMAPYRLFKAFPAEGGILAPLIVAGPTVTGKGTRCDALTHVMDLAPTFLELAGVEHPETYRGREVLPVRGVSLAPLLRRESRRVRGDDDSLGWELFGMRALRQGNWKIVWMPQPFGGGGWQLYNLATDPAETNDLSKRFPQRLQAMVKAWEKYAEEVGVVLSPVKVGS